MRAATIGLVTVPVLVAGSLGIAAAVGVIGIPSADSTRVADTNTASPSTSMATPGPVGGTAIDGAKPHLTVVDGRATFMLPGALPAILSVLSYRPVNLQPLPSTPDSPNSPASRTADQASTPGTNAFEVPRPENPATPPANGGYVWTVPLTPTTPPTPTMGGTTRSPSLVESTQIDSRTATGQRPGGQAPVTVDPVHNTPDVGDPGISAPGRPPHAADNGRPPHADQTGRPDHADQTGRPPHASDNSRGDGNRNGAETIRFSPR